MKTRIETDMHVRVELSQGYARGPREVRQELEAFIAAVKNHRDLDGYRMYINCTPEYRCSFCDMLWETWGESPDPDEPHYDPDLPVCCKPAQVEYRMTAAGVVYPGGER